MLLRVSLRNKILITFLILFVISLSICIYGFYNYNKLNYKIVVLEKKATLLNYILEARRHEKNFFITHHKDYLKTALEFLRKSDFLIHSILKEYKGYLESPDFDVLQKILREYQNALEALMINVESGSALDEKEIEYVRQKGHIITTKLEDAINKEKGAIRSLIEKSRDYLFLTVFSMVGAAIIILIFLIMNVNRPLKQIEKAIKKISRGDYELIPKIKTGDEFERLTESLNSLLSDIKKRNEQLVQSEKMAALGTLTSGVAHELNNPLNNISTSLQIVLEEIEEGDIEYQKELLSESLKQVDRAQDIVKSLLEFSRETTFSVSEENLYQLVKNTLKLIHGEVPSNVNIHLEIPDHITAIVDPRRIQQVFLNLLLNAIQAMEKVGGDIFVRAKRDEEKQGVVVEVEDTGPGIPEDLLSKIFDPFFTTKEVGKGSGLGLSVSQGIISQHGGSISVWSKVGVGTKFTIFLPDKRD